MNIAEFCYCFCPMNIKFRFDCIVDTFFPHFFLQIYQRIAHELTEVGKLNPLLHRLFLDHDIIFYF